MSAQQKFRHPVRKLASWQRVATLILSGLGLTACGVTAYDPIGTRQSIQGPGDWAQAPKVDLLLAVDDTGGMSEAYSKIQAQMPSFLSTLQGAGWDYHLATTPLDTERDVTQVAASTHDLNWGASWTPPYPGANANDLTGMLAGWVFRRPSEYNDYVFGTRVTAAKERGFETILNTLTTRQSGTGFLRDDAMLAVLVIGVGNDTSKLNICRFEGQPGYYYNAPCDTRMLTAAQQCSSAPTNVDGDSNPTCASGKVSLDHYEQAFREVKQNRPGTLKFFAAVAPSQQSNCQGASTFAGSRYRAMASRLGGANFDICTQSISSVLTGLKSQLETQRRDFELAYLFLDEEPDPATIQVKVYRAATPNVPEIIPQDPVNGWQYAGYLQDVYAIDTPAPLNLSTGYAIALNGAGRVRGNDRVEIDFVPAGVKSTETK